MRWLAHQNNCVILKRNKEQISPRRLARIAGVVYLFEFVAGVLSAVFIPGIVGGDAATLGTKIQAHQTSFWVGFAFF